MKALDSVDEDMLRGLFKTYRLYDIFRDVEVLVDLKYDLEEMVVE